MRDGGAVGPVAILTGGVIVLVVLLVALIDLFSAGPMADLTAPRPTELLRNDTSAEVFVAVHPGDCSPCTSWNTSMDGLLPPGTQRVVGSPPGTTTWYRVLGNLGRVLGCLRIVAPANDRILRVSAPPVHVVSRLDSCPE